jgi:adenylate cyclase
VVQPESVCAVSAVASAAVAPARAEAWLREQAWRLDTPARFIEALGGQLVAAGIQVARLNCHIQHLDPETIGVSYFWTAQGNGVREIAIPPEMRRREQFLNSPMAPILEGRETCIRVDLTAPPASGEWPLLADLRAEGLTEYLIVAVPFSDGTINSLSVATRAEGGFAAAEIGALQAMLPPIGRILELHALRRLSTMLLDAYVGHRSGARILGGRIRLGDVDAIDAVLWFSDLRGSTALAARLDPDDYVVALNAYFAATAGTVLEAGGEVLKFIGDAVMAAFPIDREDAAAKIAAAALDAAHTAVRKVDGHPPLDGQRLACGVGLHRGTMMYGNVGVSQRLDFTVTGTAANLVTRIEGLSKALGYPVLASPDLAELLPGEFVTLGSHALRGMDQAIEIFRPAGDARLARIALPSDDVQPARQV